MDSEQTTLIVALAVVALLLVAGLAWWATKRKKEHDHEQRVTHAGELRQEADKHAAVLPDAQIRAEERRLEAEKAQREAERAAERARAAETDLAQQEARVEDHVRTADALDPRVDHTSDDYRPETPTTDPGDTHRPDAGGHTHDVHADGQPVDGRDDTTQTGGSHRA